MNGQIAGDLLTGRTVHAEENITFYFVRNQVGHKQEVEREIGNAKWLWVRVHYDDFKDEYAYFIYTESKKIKCVLEDPLEHPNSYLKVIGVQDKNSNDRYMSVKYGIRFLLDNDFSCVSGEYTNIPRLRNCKDDMRKIRELSRRLEDYADLQREERTVNAEEEKQRARRVAWGDELKEVVDFQDDYEKQTKGNTMFQYDKWDPVVTNKTVGVAYKFYLTDVATAELNEEILNQELVITKDSLPEADELELKGIVKDYDEGERWIQLNFQKTVDYGKFPKEGFLQLMATNISYRIQGNAIDDLVEGRSINKSLLNILLDQKYKENPSFTYEKIDWMAESQEKAVNLAKHTEDFLLVQGPPGTGKTSIIVEMIKRFVDQGQRVLISSKNNLAVDNVLEKCIEKDISCVRLGREERVKVDIVKTRLLDRAAVELQKDIISRCSKEELEILDQYTNQKGYVDVLNTNTEALESIIKLNGSINELSALIMKREKKIKLSNFYRYAPLYWQKFVHFFNRNDETLREKENKVQAEITQKLNEDDTYIQSVSQRHNQTAERENLMVKVEEQLKPYKENREPLAYFTLTNEFVDQLIQTEIKVLNQLESKGVIVKEWKESLDQRQQSLYPLLLNSVMVVGATCIGINTNTEFKDVDFDVSIIDEAGQITIFDALVPMSRAKKVILIGDHKQLPPVADENLIEIIKEEKGYESDEDKPEIDLDYHQLLGESLFETLFNSCPPEKKVMLDLQYRMHPKIAAFISNEFYEGKYRSGVTAENRQLGLPVLDKPLYFFDTVDMEFKHEEEQEQEDHVVYINPTEAQIVSTVLDFLLNRGIKSQDIGVITPYKKQKVIIEEAIARALRAKMSDDEATDIMSALEIDTVDSFQGRDKNVIIFSFTRSNSEHKIGFLKELRRLNVTMTRAKYLLVMVGDSETLTKTRDRNSRKTFQNLIGYVKQQKGYFKWDDMKSRLTGERGRNE